MRTRQTPPGTDLYAEVRAGFVRQKLSLNRWCIQQDITPAWARQVLLGARKGPKAKALKRRLIEAAQGKAGVA